MVSELYHPEETSTGYFVTHIAEALAGEHEVHVLCSQPTYSGRGTRAPSRETRHGVDVERCWSTTFPKDNLPLRALNVLTFSLNVMWRALVRFRRNDVVIVVTNPPTLPYVIAVAALFRRARLWLLLHDLYPEVMVASGMTSPRSPLTWLVDRMSRILYGRAERIIALGPGMAERVRGKLRADPERVVVIPNWGDIDRVVPMSRASNALLEQLGIADRFVVQYMCNMGRTHGLDTVLEAAALMKHDDSVHFLFVGWGARKQWLEDEARRIGLGNVTILPPCAGDELPVYANACDLAIIAFRPGMAGVSVPSRMYNVFAAGKPLLAVTEPGTELTRMALEEGVGFVAEPGDPREIADAVRRAQADPSALAAMGRRARELAETHYSLREVARRYAQMVEGQAPEGAAGAG